MPIYEYVCKACDHEWEKEQRISEAPQRTCPKCKARKAKRLISQTSFVLKGGGWYSDLYSSSSGGKADSDEGATASKESAKKDAGDGGSEKPSKPSKPSESKSKDSKGSKGSKASKPEAA